MFSFLPHLCHLFHFLLLHVESLYCCEVFGRRGTFSKVLLPLNLPTAGANPIYPPHLTLLRLRLRLTASIWTSRRPSLSLDTTLLLTTLRSSTAGRPRIPHTCRLLSASWDTSVRPLTTSLRRTSHPHIRRNSVSYASPAMPGLEMAPLVADDMRGTFSPLRQLSLAIIVVYIPGCACVDASHGR